MKIIKKGKIQRREYRMICPKCGCIATYDKTDTHVDRERIYVVCPTCGYFVTHSVGLQLQFERKEHK